MNGNDRLPPESRGPALEGPTAVIRYSLRAEILVIVGRELPAAGLRPRARNGTHREGTLSTLSVPVHLEPPGDDDRHWADLGL